MQPPHSKLLTQAARAKLGPLGLKRRGASRTWLDDRGWFVTVVEFQPRANAQGSFLNVGAHFLWSWGGVFSFNLGDRVDEAFAAYDSDAQFAPEADRLASRAAVEVQSLRDRLTGPGRVASELEDPSHDLAWPRYHRAVALGLSGQPHDAAREFLRLADSKGEDYPWVLVLREKCRLLARLVVEPERFRTEILDLLAAERAALRLPPLEDPFRC